MLGSPERSGDLNERPELQDLVRCHKSDTAQLSQITNGTKITGLREGKEADTFGPASRGTRSSQGDDSLWVDCTAPPFRETAQSLAQDPQLRWKPPV